MNRTAVLICHCCLLLGACARRSPQEVLGTVERDRLELIAESNERIVEIAVREGDRVAAGAVLVRQEAGLAEPRIDQARAAQAEAQRRLADLEAGPRQREIDEARAALGRGRGRAADRPGRVRARAGRWSSASCSARRTSTRRARGGTRRSRRATPRGRASRCCRRGRARSRSPRRARPWNARTRRTGRGRDRCRALHGPCTARGPRRSAALQARRAPAPPVEPVAVLLADGAPYARVYVPEPLRARFLPGTKVEVHVDGVTGAVAGRRPLRLGRSRLHARTTR